MDCEEHRWHNLPPGVKCPMCQYELGQKLAGEGKVTNKAGRQEGYGVIDKAVASCADLLKRARVDVLELSDNSGVIVRNVSEEALVEELVQAARQHSSYIVIKQCREAWEAARGVERRDGRRER